VTEVAGTGIGYDDTMRLMAQRPITLTLVEPPAEETGVAGSAGAPPESAVRVVPWLACLWSSGS
jgi:hypothetical protein